MVLEVDQTAHYAFLFTRFRRSEPPRNEVERLFFDELKKAGDSLRSAGSEAGMVAKPSLVWADSGLALSLPKLEERLEIFIGRDSRKLRGGQQWLLPTPWPSHVDWRFATHSGRIQVFPITGHLLAFDAETGRLVDSIDPTRVSEAGVDAREVMLAAMVPFAAGEEDAFEIGRSGYALFRPLGAEGTIVGIGRQTISLRSRPKPRIWVECGVVAKGAMGPLLAEGSALGFERGGLEGGDVELALSFGGGAEILVPLRVPAGADHASVTLSDYAGGLSDLVAVKAEVRQEGSKRALVRYTVWLWPGLRGLADGLIFDSDTIPRNYSSEGSRHVSIDCAGRLCLDNAAAYERATLAFTVERERVDFAIPRPGVVVSFTDVDGRSLPLKTGEMLVVRDEDKGASLSIGCPFQHAELSVRGRREPLAFVQTSTRLLSLADLVSPASREDVSIEAPELGPAPVVLARIVPAVAPKAFSIERRAELLNVKIEMHADVDALRLSLEDEDGGSEDCNCALAYRPVAHRAPQWLSAELDVDNPRRVLARINSAALRLSEASPCACRRAKPSGRCATSGATARRSAGASVRDGR